MTGVDKAGELNIKQKNQNSSYKGFYYLELKQTREVTWGKGLNVVEESSI